MGRADRRGRATRGARGVAYISPLLVTLAIAALVCRAPARRRRRVLDVLALVAGSELLTQSLKALLPRAGEENTLSSLSTASWSTRVGGAGRG